VTTYTRQQDSIEMPLLGLKPTNLIESVLDEVGVALLIVSQSGHIAMANRAAVAMLGGDDPTGRHLSEWRQTYRVLDRQGQDMPFDQSPIMRALRGEDLEPADVRLILPDGRTKWLHGAGFRFAVLGLAGVFVIFADETKQIELRHATDLLQRLEAVGRLAGGLLHDFNNMLSLSASCVALALADASISEATRDHLQQAALALNKGASLARRLTQYSRTEPIHVRPVHLNPTVTTAFNLVRPLVDKSVRVRMELQSDLPVVEMDASEMEHVIVNLLMNALDAMPEGGELTLRTEVAPRDQVSREESRGSNEFVRICIADTGSGIPTHLHTRIFEPFFTTKPKGHGTGLGLSSAYSVVHQHRGRIEVQSAPGAGSTFRIYLPIKAGTLPHREEAA
jgi:signal transduction histidine kinase